MLKESKNILISSTKIIDGNRISLNFLGNFSDLVIGSIIPRELVENIVPNNKGCMFVKLEIKKPLVKGTISDTRAIIKALLKFSFTSLSLTSIPAKNNKYIRPNEDKKCTKELSGIISSQVLPTITPNIISKIITGKCKNLAIRGIKVIAKNITTKLYINVSCIN